MYILQGGIKGNSRLLSKVPETIEHLSAGGPVLVQSDTVEKRNTPEIF
jgi:hypothetical protein